MLGDALNAAGAFQGASSGTRKVGGAVWASEPVHGRARPGDRKVEGGRDVVLLGLFGQGPDVKAMRGFLFIDV
jgi:hypothetical protein